MSSSNHLENYLRSYAYRDLDAPKSQLVTRLLIVALGLMSSLLIIASAITFWIPAVQTSRLERSPLAKSLWIGQPENQDKLLTEVRQQQIIKETASELPRATALESMHVFKRFALKFQSKENERRPQEWMGRTVEPKDPILFRLGVTGEKRGIVVTRELLELLGFESQDTPTELAIRFRDHHDWQTIPVLFITAIRLPYNLKFLIRRTDHDAAYLEGHEVTSTGIDIGPIPEGLPSGSQLRKDEIFSAALNRWGVEIRIERRAGHSCYLLKSLDEKRRGQSQWDSILEEFREELQIYLKEHQRNAFDVKTMRQTDCYDRLAPSLPTVVYDLAEIRVRQLDDLMATARGCRKAGFPADETLVSQVDQVHRIGRSLLLALVAICIILLIIICLVIIIIQKLRCELKVPELGMLKAMGISRGEFRRLFGHQALILWRRSLILGISFATIGAAFILALTTHDVLEILLLVAYLVAAVVAVGAMILPVISVSLRLATREARQSDPMESLRCW